MRKQNSLPLASLFFGESFKVSHKFEINWSWSFQRRTRADSFSLRHLIKCWNDTKKQRQIGLAMKSVSRKSMGDCLHEYSCDLDIIARVLIGINIFRARGSGSKRDKKNVERRKINYRHFLYQRVSWADHAFKFAFSSH